MRGRSLRGKGKAPQRGEGGCYLQLEEGVLPGRDTRGIQHEAQGVGDEEASLSGTGETLPYPPQRGTQALRLPVFCPLTAPPPALATSSRWDPLVFTHALVRVWPPGSPISWPSPCPVRPRLTHQDHGHRVVQHH